MKSTLLAAATMLAGALFAAPAHADLWPCEVALCMGGPSEPACQPALNRLWRHLAKGGSWPVCHEAKGDYRVARVIDPYDPCPDGTQLLPTGGYVFEAGGQATARWTIGADHYMSPDDAGLPLRACVGNRVTRQEHVDPFDDSFNHVDVYDRIVWQTPHTNLGVTEIYADGKLIMRHRLLP